MKEVLVYGYGNPGRQDDALGVLISEHICKWAEEIKYQHVDTDSNYQLNVEDATALQGRKLVIFADASKEDLESFVLTKLEPSSSISFSNHAVSPEYIIHLTRELFEEKPEAYLLHIKGYQWEFSEGITENAKNNMNKALNFLKSFILEKFP